jgi:glucokinase
MSSDCLLIGDIGGTNARFALADPLIPGYARQKKYICADYATADLALRAYVEEFCPDGPGIVCLAAAGPVIDHTIRLTNNHWSVDAQAISTEFAGASVRLLNDFEAIAYAIPLLTGSDSRSLGSPETIEPDQQRYSLGVVGPGTGLGYAALYKRDGLLIPVTGEGGLQGFAPESQLQLDLLKVLMKRYERVPYERLVSGPGLENIYWALAAMYGEEPPQLSAAEIFSSADNGDDKRADEAVQLFFELLGQVAGNLAISMSTFDGVYIGGGIAKRYPQMLSDSRFREGFENKGGHRPLMERIPTRLITHDDPGLLGASYCALEMLQRTVRQGFLGSLRASRTRP